MGHSYFSVIAGMPSVLLAPEKNGGFDERVNIWF
jgi:hypothetical protein